MKKLLLSFLILTCTALVATAQTPAAKVYVHKPNFSPNTPAKSTDWVAYKQQIILDHQKKVQLNEARLQAAAKAAKTRKAQTAN